MKRLSLVLQCLIIAAVAGVAQSDNLRLTIDNSKPYVYIRFDHLGQRKPISEREMTCGIWLRIANNSRVPISVRTFDPGTPDPGIGLMHEVVKVVAPIGAGPSSSVRDLEASGPPIGYDLDVGSRTVIAPGRDLLFAVPADHVNPKWYIRVRFEFDLPETKSGRQPYCFVEFGWADLQPPVRSAIDKIRDGKCPQSVDGR